MKFFLKKIRRFLSRGVLSWVRVGSSLLILINRLYGKLYTKLWQYADLASYEHRFDHLRGVDNFYWVERGIKGLRYLPEKAKVLDLGCGDGIYSGIFYSTRAKHIDAIDYDHKIISLAKKYYKKPNINFICSNILTDVFPDTNYNVAFLFAVIEHFSVKEGQALLKKISLSLATGGCLLGSTPLFSEIGGHNIEHQNEFSSEEGLRIFLFPFFESIEIWVSPWPGRRECYFLCQKPKHNL